MPFEYYDVTVNAPDAEHEPTFRQGLETLGWQVIGRSQCGTAEEVAGLAADYAPEDAERFLTATGIPGTTLRSPDMTAFAVIGWFWGTPGIRLKTMLDSQTLVETEYAWNRDPVLQVGLRHIHLFMNRKREQTRNEASGRSIRIVHEPSPLELSEAHQRHVAEVSAARGCRPVTHTSMAQAVELLNQAMAHAFAVSRRIGLIAGLLPVAVLFVPTAAIFVWWNLGAVPEQWEIPVLALPFAMFGVICVFGPFVAVRLYTPVGYVRFVKPRFRGTTLDARTHPQPSSG